MKKDTRNYLVAIRDAARFAAFEAVGASPERQVECRALETFINRRLRHQPRKKKA